AAGNSSTRRGPERRRFPRSTAGGSARGRAARRGPWPPRSCRRRPRPRARAACRATRRGRSRSRGPDPRGSAPRAAPPAAPPPMRTPCAWVQGYLRTPWVASAGASRFARRGRARKPARPAPPDDARSGRPGPARNLRGGGRSRRANREDGEPGAEPESQREHPAPEVVGGEADGAVDREPTRTGEGDGRGGGGVRERELDPPVGVPDPATRVDREDRVDHDADQRRRGERGEEPGREQQP